jgi:hypothetical protein
MDNLERNEIIRKEAIASYNAAYVEHEKGTNELSAIELANTSLHLWRQVGNNQNLAIGYWLLSRIYAQFGHAHLAIETAEESLAHLSAIDEPADWLIASINEGWTRALIAAGDVRADAARAKTRDLIASIADSEDRELIGAQFEEISE